MNSVEPNSFEQRPEPHGGETRRVQVLPGVSQHAPNQFEHRRLDEQKPGIRREEDRDAITHPRVRLGKLPDGQLPLCEEET